VVDRRCSASSGECRRLFEQAWELEAAKRPQHAQRKPFSGSHSRGTTSALRLVESELVRHPVMATSRLAANIALLQSRLMFPLRGAGRVLTGRAARICGALRRPFRRFPGARIAHDSNLRRGRRVWSRHLFNNLRIGATGAIRGAVLAMISWAVRGLMAGAGVVARARSARRVSEELGGIRGRGETGRPRRQAFKSQGVEHAG